MSKQTEREELKSIIRRNGFDCDDCRRCNSAVCKNCDDIQADAIQSAGHRKITAELVERIIQFEHGGLSNTEIAQEVLRNE